MNELQQVLNEIKTDKIENLKPGNLREGISLLGVEGTAEVPEPIYSTVDYQIITVTSDMTAYPYFNIYNRFNDYIVVRYCNTTSTSRRSYSQPRVYKIENNELHFLFELSQPSASGTYYIIGIYNNIMYIAGQYYGGGYLPSKLDVYKIDLNTNTFLEQISPSLSNYPSMNIVLDNFELLELYNEYYVVFDPITEKFNKTSLNDIGGSYIGNNCLIYTYNGGTEGGYNSKIFSFTKTSVIYNNQHSDISYDYLQLQNGLNYNKTKLFQGGNVYQTNAGLVRGDLLKQNVCDKDIQIYTLNDKYYVLDKSLCIFNEDTNTFEEVLNIESDFSFSGNSSGYLFYTQESGKRLNIISFNKSNSIIGFKYNNNNYMIGSDVQIKTDNILNGFKYYDQSGNQIIGSMPNNGDVTITPTLEEQTKEQGYYNSLTIEPVTSEIDTNIKPENIKKRSNYIRCHWYI